MASLQSSYSFTVLATNPHHRISPFSATKPSQHFLNARRSHRVKISCNGGGDAARIDRRNMLLGLGGLYGAGSLISDREAQANPIKPPEFDKCETAGTYNFGTTDAIDINCCPPPSDKIIDYKLPPVNKLRIRPAAQKLSDNDAAKYAEAVRRMKELDETDPSDPRGFTQQAMIHCAYCNGAHNQAGFPGVDISVHYSWIFFPFHRWYLFFYERILGSLINDPTFALPFWNWDNPDGMQLPAIFNDPKSALYDPKRNQSHLPPNIVNLTLGDDATDPKKIVANNLSSLYNEMIGGVNSAADFMGQPYREGDPVPPTTSGGTSERGSHIGVHAWVGDTREPYRENLGNFYSAGRDPVFYSHHSNVDRMWVIWRQIRADYSKEITEGDYLNSSFLFYDEKKQLVRVKTADCEDYKKMGYDYEKMDVPWINYRPPKKAEKAKIENLAKRAAKGAKVFPLTLKEIVRVLVPVPSEGRENHALLLENIDTDSSKLVKFDVYVNDEDDEPTDVNKAEYAGTYTQLQHKGNHPSKSGKGSLKLSLKELYQNIGIADDDDTVLVTIVPRIGGETVTIGGVKIIALPPPPPPK